MNTEQIPDSDILEYNSLSVENREVSGSALTHTFEGGYRIQITVISYDYERTGETRQNHVPNVVVTDRTGSIVTEVHANDSNSPIEAVENAVSTAEYVLENADTFLPE